MLRNRHGTGSTKELASSTKTCALESDSNTQEKSPGESQENRVHLQTLAFSVTHYGTYTEIEEFIKRVYQNLQFEIEEFTRRVY